eukprot:gene5350-6021_t
MGKKSKSLDDSKNADDNDNEDVNSNRPSYEDLITKVSVISKPLASKKLTKKLYKTVKKASKEKSLRRGVKEVAKALRKNEKGFVILAGDVSPIDVISHLPILCEDNEIPYCYVPSRMDLGLASQTKRPTSVILVKEKDSFQDYYKDCYKQLHEMPLPI